MKFLIDTCVFIDAFDINSVNHDDSLRLLEELRSRNILITMPAHGWFEIQCTLQRLIKENRFSEPTICGRMQYPVELMHIDDKFIKQYAMADIPYIKAGDHIFVSVAKVNNWPLITSDGKMIDVCKKCGVNVFTPCEFINKLSPKNT